MEVKEAPFILGKSEWNEESTFPEVWQVVHQCKNVYPSIQATEVIASWYIFLKQHNAATLEEFLQKFAEGAERKDFFDFSKYCIALYRQVHEKQLAGALHPLERKLIEQQMEGAVRMDQLGDAWHNEPGNDYWEKDASILGPDYRELPRPYLRLRESHIGFENFMAAYKKFDRPPGVMSDIEAQVSRSVVNSRRNMVKTVSGE